MSSATSSEPRTFDGIIVGPTSHPIVPLLARELAARDLRMAVMNGSGDEDREFVPGVLDLSCSRRVGETTRRRSERFATLARVVERRAVMPFAGSSLAAFEAEFGDPAAVSIVEPVRRGELIAGVVNELRPRFVFVNHAFQFGWVTARTKDIVRVAMPWGGDIYNHGPATPASRWLVRRGLRAADLVVPSAASSTEILTSTYGVANDRIRPLSWGVDLDELPPRTPQTRAAARTTLGLPADGTLVFNTRRLKAAWGSDAALTAMIAVAQRRPETHHVILAGSDNRETAEMARGRIEDLGLGSRFRVLDHDVEMATYLDYCAACDVGLSLRGSRDMRSLSILQGAAAGLDLVCSDQPEYREMAREGFVARFVDPSDGPSVEAAVVAAVDDVDTGGSRAAANRRFIESREDRPRQLDLLVAEIERVCADFR